MTPNDPLFTAYALGELDDPRERSQVQTALGNDPELQSALEEIQSLAGLCESVLLEEPTDIWRPEDTEKLMDRVRRRKSLRSNDRLVHFPALITALAACFALVGAMFVLNYVTRNAQVNPVTVAADNSSSVVDSPSGPDAAVASQGYASSTEGLMQLREEITTPSFSADDVRHSEHTFTSSFLKPLSRFAIDTGDAAYDHVEDYLNQEQLPPPEIVRIEDMINSYPFDYEEENLEGQPVSVHIELAQAPWKPQHRLARIGLKGSDVEEQERPAGNFVFLVDLNQGTIDSRSLEMIQEGIAKLLDQLNETDRVGIVAYSDKAEVLLPSTTANNRQTIQHALGRLQPATASDPQSGLAEAYLMAKNSYIADGNNRVVLCTGSGGALDNSVRQSLANTISREAASNLPVVFTALGFNCPDKSDSLLIELAHHGMGNAAFIDDNAEMERVFGEESMGHLLAVAMDVKVELSFNPAKVAAYRLIGYEGEDNQRLEGSDISDEILAGHAVTALYELIPISDEYEAMLEPSPVYQRPADNGGRYDASDELFTVKLHYSKPGSREFNHYEVAMSDEVKPMEMASADFQIAASVAAFGMILRDSSYKGSADFDLVRKLVEEAEKSGKNYDQEMYRNQFLRIVEKAEKLWREKQKQQKLKAAEEARKLEEEQSGE